MAALKRYMERIDNLTVRERAAIMAGVLAVMFMLWDTLVLAPLDNRSKLIAAELQQKQSTQVALNAQIQTAIRENQKDPEKPLQEKLASLKKELESVKNNVQASTMNLIAPRDMAKILETVLVKTEGVRLINLNGLGAEALVKKSEDKADNKTDSPAEDNNGLVNAYKHGLQIEFEGDYLSTLDYLRELESLRWGFLWDSLEFVVKDYPRSRAVFRVYTLSLQKNWIDV